MEFAFFIGIDVSKNELDFSVQQGKDFLFHQEIVNDPEAIRALLKEIGRLEGFSFAKAVFCMEHTGIYSNHLLSCLYQRKANICLESATQIKRSLGNLRGKNDKVDSMRIAAYAYKNRDELRLWAPRREEVQQLAHLSSTRSRLIKAKKMLKTPLKEYGCFVKKKTVKQNTNVCYKALKGIEDSLANVERSIMIIINTDPELKRLFTIVTSVVGIGKVTALQLIVTTNEFKDINSAKSYACYAGLAPYLEESGMLKGRGRVSHMANKKVKTLFHMSALVAIQHNDELRLFYERKVNVEKKNKMSVINAVRNKLVQRIFSCVNQNRLYEKNYQKLLA
ncbi:MAG TPA: IS110 family transposase [Candidatus Babeliaceae bacterium]|nr:IS110 family transposase [Candidatus Babeliaceae bacterium]